MSLPPFETPFRLEGGPPTRASIEAQLHSLSAAELTPEEQRAYQDWCRRHPELATYEQARQALRRPLCVGEFEMAARYHLANFHKPGRL